MRHIDQAVNADQEGIAVYCDRRTEHVEQGVGGAHSFRMVQWVVYIITTECKALRILIGEAVWKEVLWLVWRYYSHI